MRRKIVKIEMTIKFEKFIEIFFFSHNCEVVRRIFKEKEGIK